MAALGIVSLRLTLTPSGRSDSRYPDGDDGSAAASLSWDTIPLIEFQEGVGASIDLRALYLNEPGSPDATITIDGSLFTGVTLANGKDLTYSGTGGANENPIRASAVRSGVTVLSNFFIVRINAAVVSDTLAPTIVTGLTTEGITGKVRLRFDPASDPHDGSSPGSGLAEYDIKLGAAVVDTIAASPGLSLALTEQIIGTSNGTPGSTQDGHDWEDSFGGAGFDGTADQCLLTKADVSGDFVFAVMKVISLTSDASFAKYGLMIRESNAPGSRYFSIYWQKNDRLQVRWRSNTDGVTTLGVNQPQTLGSGLWLKVARIDATTYGGYYSTDGLVWNLAGTEVQLSMGSVLSYGRVTTSTLVNTNAVGESTQWSLNNLAQIVYEHTTATGGTYSVVARDADDNNAAASGGVAGTPLVSAILIREYDGHYARHGTLDSLTSILNTIDSVATESCIRGVVTYTKWNVLEPTKGNYDWAMWDAIAERLQQRNKKWAFRIQERSFSGSGTPNPLSACPSYLDTENLVYIRTTPTNNKSAGACIWDPTCMGYLIALQKAAITRYGSLNCWDGTPLLAMTLAEETTLGTGLTADVPYTVSAYMAQELRRMTELRAHAPAIPYALLTNWITGDTAGQPRMIQWYQAAAADLGVYLNGGPDMRPIMEPPTPPTNSDGFRVLMGTSGGVNYRGDYLVLASAENFELDAGFLPEDTYEAGVTLMGANTFFWLKQETKGTSAQKWSSGILPFIRTHAVNTTTPTQLIGKVTKV